MPAAPARAKRGRSAAFVFAHDEPAAPLSEADIALREYMRNWRREISQRHHVPAFVVMYDTTLEALCAARPTSVAELRRVPGFGDRKTELYGAEILRALRSYGQGMPSPPPRRFRAPLSKAARETRRLLAQGHNIEKVAALRGCRPAAVVNLVTQMLDSGDIEFQKDWIPAAERTRIEEACRRLGMERLRTIKDSLPADITYDQIRLVMAHLRRQAATADGG
jgi:ATP-dependent DNA helicase RecQ